MKRLPLVSSSKKPPSVLLPGLGSRAITSEPIDRRGEEEARRVDVEAGLLREPGDQCSGEQRREQAHGVERLRHQRVGGEQPVGGDERAQGHRLRRREEARHHAEDDEDRAQLNEVGHPRQQQHQRAAREIARHHHALDPPAVDEDARHRADDGHRQHVRDQQVGHLHRAAVPAERDQADHSEQGEEVAEDGDQLRQPELAEVGLGEDVAQVRARRRSRGCWSRRPIMDRKERSPEARRRAGSPPRAPRDRAGIDRGACVRHHLNDGSNPAPRPRHGPRAAPQTRDPRRRGPRLPPPGVARLGHARDRGRARHGGRQPLLLLPRQAGAARLLSAGRGGGARAAGNARGGARRPRRREALPDGGRPHGLPARGDAGIARSSRGRGARRDLAPGDPGAAPRRRGGLDRAAAAGDRAAASSARSTPASPRAPSSVRSTGPSSGSLPKARARPARSAPRSPRCSCAASSRRTSSCAAPTSRASASPPPTISARRPTDGARPHRPASHDHAHAHRQRRGADRGLPRPPHPARGAARGVRPHRHQARLRARRVRHLHGARRRRARALLPGARRRGRGARRSRPSRGSSRATACTRCKPPSPTSAPPSAATARRAS